MSDLYDKMTIETSIKPAFNGLDVKETKKSFGISVQSVQSSRIIIKPTNPHDATKIPDPCKEVPKAEGIIPDKLKLAFITLKAAPTNPKGLPPPLLAKVKFIPQHDCANKAVKLENDAIIYYTTGSVETDTALGIGVPTELYIFNPNKEDFAVDVKYGVLAA